MRKKDELRVLDATLRDGGLVNDFTFADACVRAIYEANCAAGVDYMEFGYRADKRMFDPANFGKWKYSTDEEIRAIVGESRSGPKPAVMLDVGRSDIRRDLHPKGESPVELVRVATYIDTVPEAIEMIEFAAQQGYETACNLSAVSQSSGEQLEKALVELAACPVDIVYVVDSFGALYPQQIAALTARFCEVLNPAGKQVGIHAHNNQQCAFANTVAALEQGAGLLDATAYGMGRGAGNCHMEALLGYLNTERYRMEPILALVQQYMEPMQAAGTRWGYNTAYLLTGLTNSHPRTAIAATQRGDTDYREQLAHLKRMREQE